MGWCNLYIVGSTICLPFYLCRYPTDLANSLSSFPHLPGLPYSAFRASQLPSFVICTYIFSGTWLTLIMEWLNFAISNYFLYLLWIYDICLIILHILTNLSTFLILPELICCILDTIWVLNSEGYLSGRKPDVKETVWCL